MTASVRPQLSKFALDVAEGLSRHGQKKLSPQYFYDDLGSALFEAITLLPEYGLTRADERLLEANARDLAKATGPVGLVAELGSGSGRKTRGILEALMVAGNSVTYCPIDVSAAALASCARELNGVAQVRPVCADWLEGLIEIESWRPRDTPMLVLFLGSSIGNLERTSIQEFLSSIRQLLRPGDCFLLGADLVKDVDRILAAYDDPIGITAAFNLNVLARINRELEADFDLRSFSHEVRWNEYQRRVEMHLVSCRNQEVYVGALGKQFSFEAGETIWTESSHKFTESELYKYAYSAGFRALKMWVDREWPFAEALWEVSSDSSALLQ